MPVTIHISPAIDGYGYGIVDDLSLPRLEKMLKKHPNLKILGHSQPFWSEIGDNVTEENRNKYVTGKVRPGRLISLLREYPNLLCDLSAGNSFAFTILLTLIGFFSGFLSEFILAKGFPSFLTLSVAALLICSAMQAFPGIAFNGVPLSAGTAKVLIQTAYSLIFVLPVYWASRGVSRLKGR